MPTLTNKRVLLGVTGGIAAYKSAEIIRRLQAAGAQVRVVMTKGAQEFITPLTMQALSGNPVHLDLLDPKAEAGMGHIELSRWADVVLVAPASANFMAKLVSGDGSDLLLALCLATPAVIAIAPAMNQGMWRNASTQANLSTLQSRAIRIFGPAAGEQACGDIGPGRMIEPQQIVDLAAELFAGGALAGRKVVISAGPTREAIDPVRYISNHSSGKMGYALAEAAMEAGAKVVLVSGPVHISGPDRVEILAVTSAIEMYEVVQQQVRDADIFIGAAAVADFRPVDAAAQKIKKGPDDAMVLQLVKNPDIIASVAGLQHGPFCVGFAAETQNVLEHARHKLTTKHLDMIIANDVSDPSIGFNSDHNAATILGQDTLEHLSLQSKPQLAREIMRVVANKFMENFNKDGA